MLLQITIIHSIGEKHLKTSKKHFTAMGLSPHSHCNLGENPTPCCTLDDARHAVTYIFETHILSLPILTRRLPDELQPYQLNLMSQAHIFNKAQQGHYPSDCLKPAVLCTFSHPESVEYFQKGYLHQIKLLTDKACDTGKGANKIFSSCTTSSQFMGLGSKICTGTQITVPGRSRTMPWFTT